MRPMLPPALNPRNLGRLAAGFLLAGVLLALAGHTQPRSASADPRWQPPQLISVRMETPNTAYVTFRETNDVGGDVTTNGLQYLIQGVAHPGGGVTRVSYVPAAGNGRTHVATVTVGSGFTCFTGTAFLGNFDD